MGIIMLEHLGARELKTSSRELFNLEEVQSKLGIKFSSRHASILEKFNGSIVFDNGAIFKPLQKTPVDSNDGYQSLEMLYGLNGDSNLISRNKMYREQIPSDLVTIGESVGGNQICLSSKNGKIYFWYHEATTDDESLYKISDSTDEFLSALKTDTDQGSSNKEIDESGSFLDF